jgi:hypothetical protein
MKNWKLTALIAVCSFLSAAPPPRGWFMAGSKPAEYDSGIDSAATYNSQPSAYLKAQGTTTPATFGTLMQQFRAERYQGKRVRFSALVKTEGIQNWAGLWMRMDKGTDSVAFDNMQDRPLKGTTGWKNYEIVLDVPQDATGIFFGVLLEGKGAVWLNSVSFDVVASDTPTTGKPTSTSRLPDGPTNLRFEK